ncbi:hypothetical protein ANO14919_022640 [Xylariales sp. No.14919]|nr:hypothetical protein ANO14919_022640 [Xylariales sp. No.14919]
MAEDAPPAHFQSIAEAATASWYAHRASSPNSGQSPFIHQDSTQRQTPASTVAASASASAPPTSPAPQPPHPLAASTSASMDPGASSPSSPTSSRRESEARVAGEVGIRSDITAWQSALQSLPFEFANSQQPIHPLAQALIHQPTLRPVEWNQYRQQGGFVPRTAHDYSSLMIYISGQVNPNPCRNCLLRNGPFARCVVSPPAVLAITTLRHACANCTYQNQYKKCTNEPISEQEKARSEMARSITRSKNPTSRPTVPRKPKTNSRTDRDRRRELELQRLLQEQQQHKQQLEDLRDVPMTQSPATLGAGLGDNLASFDEKLRYIRARSPRSRLRIAAEMLQWQAAIATVEAEKPAPTPDLSVPSPIREATLNHHLRAPLNNYTPSQLISTSSAATTAHAFAMNPPDRARTINYSVENTYEPMDEDESESDEEDYEGTPWVGPNQPDSIIKAPR